MKNSILNSIVQEEEGDGDKIPLRPSKAPHMIRESGGCMVILIPFIILMLLTL